MSFWSHHSGQFLSTGHRSRRAALSPTAAARLGSPLGGARLPSTSYCPRSAHSLHSLPQNQNRPLVSDEPVPAAADGVRDQHPGAVCSLVLRRHSCWALSAGRAREQGVRTPQTRRHVAGEPPPVTGSVPRCGHTSLWRTHDSRGDWQVEIKVSPRERGPLCQGLRDGRLTSSSTCRSPGTHPAHFLTCWVFPPMLPRGGHPEGLVTGCHPTNQHPDPIPASASPQDWW